jgi:hypothetical protein
MAKADDVFTSVKDILKIILLYLIIGGGFSLYYNDNFGREKKVLALKDFVLDFVVTKNLTVTMKNFFKIHNVSELVHRVKDLKRNFKVLKGYDCNDAFEGDAKWKFMEVNSTFFAKYCSCIILLN